MTDLLISCHARVNRATSRSDVAPGACLRASSQRQSPGCTTTVGPGTGWPGSGTACEDQGASTGGPATADYPALNRLGLKLAQIFSVGERIHVTCPNGTDLTADISGRPGAGTWKVS